MEYIQEEQNTKINNDKFTWQTFKKGITNNLTSIKAGLVIISILFLYYVYISQTSQTSQTSYKIIQDGGSIKSIATTPFKLGSGMTKKVGSVLQKGSQSLGTGIDKARSGLGKLGKASPLQGGFTILFQFINVFMMIFGIIIILVLIPTIPILIFFAISYYICRRKIWELRTL
jgi:hypothetical protein